MHRSCCASAAAAQAYHFHGLGFDAETDGLGAGDDGAADAVLLKLDGHVACAADQELTLVRVLRMAAADKGVE
ncbi:hypothetical protein D3C76_1776370 [compost metagenome]